MTTAAGAARTRSAIDHGGLATTRKGRRGRRSEREVGLDDGDAVVGEARARRCSARPGWRSTATTRRRRRPAPASARRCRRRGRRRGRRGRTPASRDDVAGGVSGSSRCQPHRAGRVRAPRTRRTITQHVVMRPPSRATDQFHPRVSRHRRVCVPDGAPETLRSSKPSDGSGGTSSRLRSATRRATRSLLARRAIRRSRACSASSSRPVSVLDAPVAQDDRDEDLVVVDRQVVDPGLGDRARRARRSRGCRRRASRSSTTWRSIACTIALGSSSMAADGEVAVEEVVQVLVGGDAHHHVVAGAVAEQPPGVAVGDAGRQLLQRHVDEAVGRRRRARAPGRRRPAPCGPARGRRGRRPG